MSGSEYAIVAYVIGLGLMWGYAATMWLSSRRLNRAVPRDGVAS
jgi:hypothetical protein